MSSELEDVLQRKWTLPLLRLLDEEGETNFNVMVEDLDISSSTLTDTMDLLMEYGLIDRNELKRTDIRYDLTSEGELFLDKIQELEQLLNNDD